MQGARARREKYKKYSDVGVRTLKRGKNKTRYYIQ